jgi:hypothetical protein
VEEEQDDATYMITEKIKAEETVRDKDKDSGGVAVRNAGVVDRMWNGVWMLRVRLRQGETGLSQSQWLTGMVHGDRRLQDDSGACHWDTGNG